MAACVASGSARAETTAKGRIFEPVLSPEAPMFFYETNRETTNGRDLIRTRYNDPQGKPLVEEDTVLEAGKLVRYDYNQRQTDEKGFIEVKDGKVSYSYTAQGKTKTDQEDLEPGMIVPDMLIDSVRGAWDTLMKGDDLKVRLLLLELQDSVGFKIFKDSELTFQGKPAVEMKLKPSSIFISAMVPAIKLIVEKEAPHRLLQMTGRLPVRIAQKFPPESRKDWKAMDGRLALDYGATASPPVESAPAAAVPTSVPAPAPVAPPSPPVAP